MTLKEAVNSVIDLLPPETEITSPQFVAMVRGKYPQYRYKMDGTIMRRQREVKADAIKKKYEYIFICINPIRFLYKKMKLKDAKPYLGRRKKKPKNKKLFITRAA